MNKRAVIAVGGNSLIIDKDHKSVPDQYGAIVKTVTKIIDIIEKGYEIVITHGNGPQVGFILFRSDYARERIHTIPLDSCVADTQGSLGYNFQMALRNEFRNRGIDKSVTTVVTQVVVDSDDPAFKDPKKPIGSFYTKSDAEDRKKAFGWDIMEDAGRGWRRVVPSPFPREIVEIDSITKLLSAGSVVIAAGGGGIPVARDKSGNLKGVEAVIDKDRASSLLAGKIDADIFIISTAVEKVCLNYGKPNERQLDRMTLEEAKRYMDEGHFSPGSMRPKIEAVIDFIEGGGEEALICDPNHLGRALDGHTGTRITRS